jgi:hypothetical protein
MCPNCQNQKLVPIWYGKPTSQELLLAIREEIALGGAIFKNYSHYCYSCHSTFPSNED